MPHPAPKRGETAPSWTAAGKYRHVSADPAT
jgi:hypothetical protein